MDVERWYEDYLRSLYEWIEFSLSPQLHRTTWHNAKVEFIFSVPTTWNPLIVEKFRAIAAKAGYGKVWNHSLKIGLTEAEAAAVHTSIEASATFNVSVTSVLSLPTVPNDCKANPNNEIKEHDVLLVCDVGGGTTVRLRDCERFRISAEINVLNFLCRRIFLFLKSKILKTTRCHCNSLMLFLVSLPSLNQTGFPRIIVYEGETIGSVAIDYDFKEFVEARFEQAGPNLPLAISPEQAAWEMMKSRDFQNTKCEYGGPHDTPKFHVPIPRIDHAYVNHLAGIENGEMRFTRSVMLYG